MKKLSKPVVFFGSGPVAARSLELLAPNFEIEAVITKPRAEHHKGDVPVLDVAQKLSLPVFTATDKRSLDELIATKPFRSEIGILIDFGIIVSQKVIDYFPLGIINSHFSLLPEWRGADPITFSILSGQEKTGVSLMMLTAGMDEGPLLAQASYDIHATMTTPELTDALIDQSYRALSRILPLYILGQVKPAPQETVTLAPSTTPTYSRKLTKEDGLLDWSKPAERLEREIRAFIEWPKSRTTLGGKDVIITKAHAVPGNNSEARPGEVELSLLNDGILMLETADGRLCIDSLRPAGKKEMTGKAFLAGYKKLLI